MSSAVNARTAEPRKRRLVVANFFPAFHPSTSGGEQRYYHLYKEISRHFDVTLVSTTYPDKPEEVIEHSSTFREYRVPKDPNSDQLHWQLDQSGIGPECSGYVVALGGAFNGAFGARLRELAQTAEAVIHESPFTVPYDTAMGTDGIPRIYNSYNVEADLARQMLRGQAGEKAAEFIEDLERYLLANCALVFATSPEEREVFIRRFGVDAAKVHLAPNGFDEASTPARDPNPRPESNKIVFVGSAHPPNIEALEFIAATVAPACPYLHFEVIGSVCNAFRGAVPRNLSLLGFIDVGEKSRVLSACAAAINPLASGAGTNLKMLDYMAHGVPIVTTAVGARGLDLSHGEHAVIAGPEIFAQSLKALVADSVRASELGRNAWIHAREKYTWKSIGDSVAAAIEQMFEVPRLPPRRRVLSICDYPVAAMSGGGQVRICQLLLELGREFDVTFLCLSDDEEDSETVLGPGLIQRAFAKSAEHRRQQQRAAEGEWISIADIISARECLGNSAFVEAFQIESARADLVLFEQCFLAPMLQWVPDGVPIVYSSQNHEAELKRSLFAQRRDGRQLLLEVEDIERRVVTAATSVVCVSDADARSFAAAYPEIRAVVVENGVHIPARRSDHSNKANSTLGSPLAVFVGSGHPPNAIAARFIIESVAPKTPDVLYAIVGSVCEAFDPYALPSNVLLMGLLSSNEKLALLQVADIAVNPMFDGGGSSLKVPDFFSVGLPMVSSKLGVRGYPVDSGVHYLEGDQSNFSEVVTRLVGDSQLRARIGSNALYLVKREFDWQILGGKLRRTLRGLVPSPPRRQRLLVVTYRFGEPPRGGAETFLAKILEHIDVAGNWEITLVSTAVGAIRNHQMFSAIYDEPSASDRIPAWSDNTHLFPVDEPADSLTDDCRRLHSLWMAESRVLGRRFLHALPEAALAGGWNYPEVDGRGRNVRWSSACSQFRVPTNTSHVRLVLHASAKGQVELWQAGTLLSATEVSGQTTITCRLPQAEGLLELRVSTQQFDEDSRELGVLVQSIEFGSKMLEHEIDLAHDLDLIPDRVSVQEWIGALIDLVNVRDAADDELFLRVRGPNSLALRRWLDAESGNYDVVLAHGVPFASSAVAVDAARRAGLPVVVLPHYHMEDRYYHRKAFYEMFRSADRVIAAPNASVGAFFERIGAKAVALPGGGVTLEEFEERALEIGRREFLNVYTNPKPFILILGRKADGKNYQVVLEAHKQLRSQGIALDVVMIGPDDDGHPVAGAGVTYLGSQPRSVVVGALAQALCLVTMSESESFGIVLLEAWLAGTPVIATKRCRAFTEIVQDGINGRLVLDTELVAAFRCYYDDRKLAESHAMAGRETALGYGWRELAAKIDSVLSSCLNSTTQQDHSAH